MRELVNTITSKRQDSTIEGFIDKMYDHVEVSYKRINDDPFAPIVSATYLCYKDFLTYIKS